MARDSDDVLRSIGDITQRFAERGDVLGETIFADEAVGPHQLHELAFFDGATARGDQYAEEIECFGRERDDSIAAPQFSRAAVQSKRPELVALVRCRASMAD